MDYLATILVCGAVIGFAILMVFFIKHILCPFVNCLIWTKRNFRDTTPN